MRHFILCLTLLVGFAACTKHSGPSPDPKDSVIGRWLLVKAVGGIVGITFTPDKDSVYALQMNHDSTWDFRMNNRVTASGTFTSTIWSPGGVNQDFPALIFKPTPGWLDLYTLRNDTLTLTDQAADAYTSTYVRAQN